ncbi:MAG: arylsulfatase [Bacteroidota bacterium]
MNYHKLLTILVLLAVSCQKQQSTENTSQPEKTTTKKPNIIIFYVDDLGYGDVSSYGATLVNTPNIDKLADNGLKMTDAHCSAATCTPSRYSLLTGSYAFRNKAAILPGDAPLIIDTTMATIPSMLKKTGYNTAVVGKWHLGLGDGTLNWNNEIKPGPIEVGFDYCFLIPATGDRVPCVYVENHQIVGLEANDPLTVSYEGPIDDEPKAFEHPELLRYASDRQHSDDIINGVGRIGYMSGGNKALWVDEEFPDILTQKSKEFIQKNKDNPFFLFYSFHDIHVPRLPHPRFEGKTEMGPRGDAIVQMDWCVGEIVNQVEALGIAENTLIIFTSDNGPVLNDGYEDLAVEKLGKHSPAGPFRGGKYSAFEAGTRVPTIAYWPGKIQPKESSALFSQVDLFTSLAKLTQTAVENNDAPDSFNLLPVLLGESEKGREMLIEESVLVLSLRKDQWKYIPPTEKEAPWMIDKGIEGGFQTTPQLYDLSKDIGEQENVADQFPEIVKEMDAQLKIIETAKGTRQGFGL